MSEYANPFLACHTCHRFVSGSTETATGTMTLWPCGHTATTWSVCPSWSPVGAQQSGCTCTPGTHRVPCGPAGGRTPTADDDPDRTQTPPDRLVHAAVSRALEGARIRSGADSRIYANRVTRAVCDVLGIAHSVPPGVSAQ
jgi:hypothetical protein